MSKRERDEARDEARGFELGKRAYQADAAMTTPASEHVYGRRGTRFQKVRGRVVGQKACTLESCGGMRLGVRWPDGRLTWPCTKGMTHDGRDWRIA